MTTVLVLAAVAFAWLLIRAVNEPSVLVVGSPGTGKSYAAAWDALHFPGAVVVLDPHVRSLARLALLHLPVGEVLWDRLDDLDHALGYDLLTPPDPAEYPDPDRRAQEARRRVHTFVEILLRRRGADSVAHTPLLDEWLSAAVALWMNGARAWPLGMLPSAFQPGTDEFRALVRGCVLPDVRAKFESLEELRPRTLRTEVGSAARLVNAVFHDPSFRRRSRGGFDLGRFLQGGGKLLVEGGDDIDDDAKRVLLCGIGTLVRDHARRRPAPHPPIRIYLDECVNAGLVGPKEQRAIAEVRKYALSYYLISQLLNHPGGADEFLQVCNRHEVFRTPHYELARKMATELEPVWPPDDRTRADRVAGLTAAIMRQAVGHRHVKDGSAAWDEQVAVLEGLPDWPGLEEAVFEEKLAWVYANRPEYRATGGSSSRSSSAAGTPPTTSSAGDSSPASRLTRRRGGSRPAGGPGRS